MESDKIKAALQENFPKACMLFEALGNQDFTSPKQVVKAMIARYENVGFLEKCCAARTLAPHAHLANPSNEIDSRILRVLNEAQQGAQPHARHVFPPIRLVIADSDFPLAYTGRLPTRDTASIIITTRMAEMLDDRQLKTVLAHELGHIDRDLRPSIISQWILSPLKQIATRNASRRNMERQADAFAIRTSGDVEAWEKSIQITQAEVSRLTGIMKDIMSSDTVRLNKKSLLGKIADWFSGKALDKANDIIGIEPNSDSKPMSRWETIRKAPKYPSLGERIRQGRELADRERIMPPESPQR